MSDLPLIKLSIGAFTPKDRRHTVTLAWTYKGGGVCLMLSGVHCFKRDAEKHAREWRKKLARLSADEKFSILQQIYKVCEAKRTEP